MDESIGYSVQLERSLHLELVSDLNLTVLAHFGTCVNLFASPDPEHLELDLIGSVLHGQLTNAELKRQLEQLHVRVEGGSHA